MAVLTDYIIAKRALCTCESCDPSASSILSNFVQAFLDRLVLSHNSPAASIACRCI